MAATVAAEPLARLDYAEVVDPDTLAPLDGGAGAEVRLLAGRLGGRHPPHRQRGRVGPAAVMRRRMMKSKIHRATVTGADVDYAGSISLDTDLMKRADILEWEQVAVLDVDNGDRFETYAIAGEPGQVQLNGAAARLVELGPQGHRDDLRRLRRRRAGRLRAADGEGRRREPAPVTPSP